MPGRSSATVVQVLSLLLLPLVTNIASGTLPAELRPYTWTAWLFVIPLTVVVVRGSRQPKATTPASSPADLPDTVKRQERQRVLEELQTDWIDGVLEQSLRPILRLNLQAESRPDLLEQATPGGTGKAERSHDVLLADVMTSNLLARPRASLLIVGGPGAGKTTLLLELAREFLHKAQEDDEQPLPVILSLSSWSADQSLTDWLVAELNKQYEVPRDLGREWVARHGVIPLLDGLDELHMSQREECVAAINAARLDEGLLAMVVSSRLDAYEALTTRLRVRAAISLKALTREQVLEYLGEAGPSFRKLRVALKGDETLWDLLRSPLMLSVVTQTYESRPLDDLLAANSLDARRSLLFSTYVDEMFQRRGDPNRYDNNETIRRLGWLARSMDVRSVFYPDWVQPSWLPKRPQARLATVGVSVMCGLAAGLLVLLIWTVITPNIGDPRFLAAMSALLVGGAAYSVEIVPADNVRWSWGRMGQVMRDRLLLSVRLFTFLGAMSGLFIGYGRQMQGEGWLGFAYGVIYGVTGGLAFGLLVGVIVGWAAGSLAGIVARPSEPSTAWRHGIQRSARNAVLVGPRLGALFGTVGFLGWISEGLSVGFGYGLTAFLIGGTMAGLNVGGRSYLQHMTMRRLLMHAGLAPADFRDFLEYATRLTFLRRVGEGYIFLHRLFQQYLAAEEPDSRFTGTVMNRPDNL